MRSHCFAETERHGSCSKDVLQIRARYRFGRLAHAALQNIEGTQTRHLIAFDSSNHGRIVLTIEGAVICLHTYSCVTEAGSIALASTTVEAEVPDDHNNYLYSWY